MWVKQGVYALHQDVQEGRTQTMHLLRIHFPCRENADMEAFLPGLEAASGRAFSGIMSDAF
jgi:hypothetical protein